MATLSAPGLDKTKSDFIIDFYKASDQNEKGGDQYVNFLTPDVDFTMGLKSIKGHAAVKDFRKGMWNGVASRLHKPKKAYSLDEKASEVMLFGTVEYGLDSGKSATVEWAARMVFAPSSEQLKLASYQVWLDSTPLKEAMAAK